jgi:predicted regulator of Ras-like GTPase activity (Roadblock/LC7/MglB family)
LFAETLKKVVDNVEGGLGAIIMGLDGIPVDTYQRNPERVDITTVAMEFSFILGQAVKASDTLKLGPLDEFSLRADRLVLVTRMLTQQYFIAVAMAPEGNFGKCRYLMRLAVPGLTAQL